MKINKKGTIKWIVVITGILITGAVILYILLGLLGETREQADKVIDVAREPDKIDQKDDEVDPELENAFNQFAETLEQNKGQACLVEYNGFPKKIKEGHMYLARLDNKIFMQLFNKREQLILHATISKTPCVVNAKKFYENCLIKNDCKNEDNIIETEIIIKDGEMLFKDGKGELDDSNLMFQFNETHICFFPIHDPLIDFNGCNVLEKENTLDEDCLEDIKKGKYPLLKKC